MTEDLDTADQTSAQDGAVETPDLDGTPRSAAGRRLQIGARAMALAGFVALTLGDGDPTGHTIITPFTNH